MCGMKTIIAFIKKEVVFVVAFVLACVSSFFVPVSEKYLSYIDFNVLFLLFAFMVTSAALRKYGVFDCCADFLCGKVSSVRALCLILVFLCFFFSMLITNDVTLLTFVPFTILILQKCSREKYIIYVVVLQTIAANLGSMATPMGNPQNLFMYSSMGISFADFCKIICPYTIISGILLLICIMFVKPEKLSVKTEAGAVINSKFSCVVFLLMFCLCMATVLKVVPSWFTALAVLFAGLILCRDVMLKIDYVLLLTFTAFFIFTGNVSNIPAVKEFLYGITSGKEFGMGICTSQIISNVPAVLLLFPFSTNAKDLLLGVNIGGCGTIIASLASLISMKLYLNSGTSTDGKKYMLVFSLLNVLFLGVLIAAKLIFSAWF